MIGECFGKLTVLGKTYTLGNGRKRPKMLCKCDCGNICTPSKQMLLDGRVKSCGCLVYHGHSNDRTYRSWYHMKSRCSDPKNIGYKNYGGRGIKVCESWLKFKNFLVDMGVRPDYTSIDRINNEGDYEPNNCRWATINEQNNNRRKKVE